MNFDDQTDEMTTVELARLHDWFKLHGLSDTDYVDCIHYIADGTDSSDNASADPNH